MTALTAGSSKAYGYTDESKLAAPLQGGGMAQPSAPQPQPEQLTANQPWDIGGPAKAIIGRVGHFAKGVTEGRGPGGGLPGGMMGGDAAEGAAGAGEAAGAAEGLGAIAADAAPLALAAL